MASSLNGSGLPWPAQLALAVYLLLLDSVFALGAYWLRASTRGLLAIAALFAVIEHADSRLPMWGTALSVARLAAAIPGVPALISLAGVSAVVLWLVWLQSLFAAGLARRRPSFIVAAISLAVAPMALGARHPLPPTHTLRAAAIGWVEPPTAGELVPLVERAAADHARFVVFPEASVSLSK